jgi:hypothetical protein
MTDQSTHAHHPSGSDERDPERSQHLFLLARAQLAAGRAEPQRLDVERRRWRTHRRLFG